MTIIYIHCPKYSKQKSYSPRCFFNESTRTQWYSTDVDNIISIAYIIQIFAGELIWRLRIVAKIGKIRFFPDFCEIINDYTVSNSAHKIFSIPHWKTLAELSVSMSEYKSTIFESYYHKYIQFGKKQYKKYPPWKLTSGLNHLKFWWKLQMIHF